MPKMSGYVKTFKFEDKNNKSISFLINDEKLLGDKHMGITFILTFVA